MRKSFVLLMLVAAMSLMGCSQHVGNFTALSSSSFDGKNLDSKHLVKDNVRGDSCSLQLLGIPLQGMPKVDQAVSEALSKNKGDIMTNARLYSRAWTAFLIGQVCWSVEGDVYKTQL